MKREENIINNRLTGCMPTSLRQRDREREREGEMGETKVMKQSICIY